MGNPAGVLKKKREKRRKKYIQRIIEKAIKSETDKKVEPVPASSPV